MLRLLTSFILLTATLMPAQAGLFDWANSGSATNLSGTGTPSALFQITNGAGDATRLDQGDIVTAIFDFGDIGGRSVFGYMRARADFVNASGYTWTDPSGASVMEAVLTGAGFSYGSLTATSPAAFNTPTFALLSHADTAKTLANVEDENSASLGLKASDGWELDLIAGLEDAQDTQAWIGSGAPINVDGTGDTGLDFVQGLTVKAVNAGSGIGFNGVSYTYGSNTKISDIVTTALSNINYTSETGYQFAIDNGPALQFFAVPEPSSLAIVGLVGLAAGWRSRRRR